MRDTGDINSTLLDALDVDLQETQVDVIDVTPKILTAQNHLLQLIPGQKC